MSAKQGGEGHVIRFEGPGWRGTEQPEEDRGGETR